MTVSIIIAVKDYRENLRECVSKCLALSFKDYEIIILPDISFSKEGIFSYPNIKIIPTGPVTPPYKRDLGGKQANGEILAFLDDDAYPVKDWLAEAVNIFESDENIACVCGPAVTPPQDSLSQKASGLVYSSRLVSGNHRFRYVPEGRKEVFDFPSCNLLIRKEVFDDIGGFDKPFWPGEDTFLCLKVLETGKKMIYDPKVLVYHHRRTLFEKHLIQIKNYAYHRGYFAKKYPKTSFRPEYFLPSLFSAGVLGGGVLGVFFPAFKMLYLTVIGFYLGSVGINTALLAFKEKHGIINKIRLFFLVSAGIIMTHLTYGVYFIRGLLADKMPEEAVCK
ncbi:MAG: glycosyltransferase [Candidatus Omnitrophica bacterium]|nr:glycosyltransferase [Candidatus Omnitrophota bacterium]